MPLRSSRATTPSSSPRDLQQNPVGHRVVAEPLTIFLALQNTNGLHVAFSGQGQDPCLHDDLKPGTVFLFDEVSLSEDLPEVLISATANFREPIEHRPLTAGRRLRVRTIPERCVWCLGRALDLAELEFLTMTRSEDLTAGSPVSPGSCRCTVRAVMPLCGIIRWKNRCGCAF